MAKNSTSVISTALSGSFESISKLSDFQTVVLLLFGCYALHTVQNMIFDRSTEYTTKNGEIQKNTISVKPVTV